MKRGAILAGASGLCTILLGACAASLIAAGLWPLALGPALGAVGWAITGVLAAMICVEGPANG